MYFDLAVETLVGLGLLWTIQHAELCSEVMLSDCNTPYYSCSIIAVI